MDEAARLFNIHVENNVITAPDLDLDPSDGLGATIYQIMDESKDLPFQIDGATEKIDTYGANLQRCIRTAIAMRARGIKPGDIITVCSSNHFNTNVPIIASFFLGAIPANTDPNLPLSDTIHLLNLVEPKIIFVSTEAVGLIENVLKETSLKAEIVVFGDTTNHTSFSSFLKESEEESNFEIYKTPDLTKTAIIFFSSGTSGLSKAICLSHLTLLKQLRIITETGLHLHKSVLLSTSLVYWISYIVSLFVAIHYKMSRLILAKSESRFMWEYVEKYKVSALFSSPTEIATLLESPPPEGNNVSSVQLLAFGGAAFSKEQMIQLRSYVPNAATYCGYGSTEIGGIGLCFQIANEHDIWCLNAKPTSCGRPLFGNIYKVVDPNTGEALGPNQEGELRIKNEFQMVGYYKMDSSDQWDSDGFFKTGDVAYYDNDYCFFIVGRFKEMLKYRGFQITPIKLENILRTHPAVQDVVVLGLPHPIDSERPIALVVLNSDFKGKVTPEEINKYYEERVEDVYKLRGGLKFIDKVIKNSAGKVQRREMFKILIDNNS